MAYEIRTIRDFSEIGSGNPAEISIYNWGGDYRPVSKGIVCYVKNQGFAVRMTSEEENPRAVQTKPNSSVCEDSCLEFFVNFAPSVPGSGYLNFEGNAAGTMLCCYGQPSKPGAKRVPIAAMGYPHPRPHPIRGIYGTADFKPDSRIRGSFYKCGDRTEHPHYGSFVKIDWPTPNFHRPEFFADMVITE